MLCHFDPVMIEDLHIIFDPVSQLNGKPLRLVENYLNVVRAVLIARTNP